MKIKQLAKILDKDEEELLLWLYELPEEFSFKINRDEIEFEHHKEISKHIDFLEESFAKWEESHKNRKK